MTEKNTPEENAPSENADRAAEAPEGAAGSSETPLEEIDLGTPPPRPGREARRFYGTPAQIRSALKFYRVMAFITGIFLLVMVAKILISGSLFGWVFWDGGQELYIGGNTATGEENIIGFFPAESLQDARSTSTLIAQAHGVAYIVYLVAGFRLWYMIRWGMGRLALIISGGLVPFFSFFVERKIVGFVKKDLESEPEAAPRY